jgi:hypothetical protein
MYLGSYICGRNGDGDKVMTGLRHTRHRSFEDFSYGKQSLDGLLFPQRAFFILGRPAYRPVPRPAAPGAEAAARSGVDHTFSPAAPPFFGLFCLLFTLFFLYLRTPFEGFAF